jgi:hypothetical protein
LGPLIAAVRRSERQDFPKLVLHGVKLRCGQLAHLAGDHVVFDGSDDASDDGWVQKAGFAPRLDFVVSRQEPTDVAGDSREDRLPPTLMVLSVLTMRPGRCVAPFSSAKTNLTSTTSPRLKRVICRVLWIVPKVRQDWISAFGECYQIGRRQLVGEIMLQTCLDGFPHIVPNRLVAFRRCNVNAAPRFAWNINTQARSTLRSSRHGATLRSKWHKYVNVSMWALGMPAA